MSGRVHVIGAGLAGLSAAVHLASRGVELTLYEATAQAGGRCRSYHDSALDMEIDNGNHLILSGNHATLSYLATIGSTDSFSMGPAANYPFMDLATGERWTVRANDGPIPWWIFDGRRNVPGARLGEYLGILKLARARRGKTVGETIDCAGPLYERLTSPFLLAALNTSPAEGSAALAGAVIRETLVRGGSAYRPMIARNGLSKALVEPALRYIADRGGCVAFGRRLRNLRVGLEIATGLDFAEASVELGMGDSVVLAVPPSAAGALAPGIKTPTTFRAIVNAHYRIDPPAKLPPMTGVINGLAEWLFAFPHRLSVTISGADRLLDVDRADLARQIWSEVAKVAEVEQAMPPWQIIRETRATIASIPSQERLRPDARTVWKNLALAGDWTNTGLPGTIEGAVRSGVAAARVVAA